MLTGAACNSIHAREQASQWSQEVRHIDLTLHTDLMLLTFVKGHPTTSFSFVTLHLAMECKRAKSASLGGSVVVDWGIDLLE
jgi:hypothetical protein